MPAGRGWPAAGAYGRRLVRRTFPDASRFATSSHGIAVDSTGNLGTGEAADRPSPGVRTEIAVGPTAERTGLQYGGESRSTIGSDRRRSRGALLPACDEPGPGGRADAPLVRPGGGAGLRGLRRQPRRHLQHVVRLHEPQLRGRARPAGRSRQQVRAGRADRGQPTHFDTRRHKDVFKCRRAEGLRRQRQAGRGRSPFAARRRRSPARSTASGRSIASARRAAATARTSTRTRRRWSACSRRPQTMAVQHAVATLTISATDDGLPKRRAQR